MMQEGTEEGDNTPRATTGPELGNENVEAVLKFQVGLQEKSKPKQESTTKLQKKGHLNSKG